MFSSCSASSSYRGICSHRFSRKVHRKHARVLAASQTDNWTPPWAITFDLRERETQWSSENQARLVKLFAAEKLDIDVLEAEMRVAQLCLIIPNLSTRINTMKPEVLAGLLRDPYRIASTLANLKASLPQADISSLVSSAPQILLRGDVEIVGEVEKVGEILKISFKQAQRIVSTHPRFLEAELVREVVEELQRLMPDKDASATLQAEPTLLLRVERGPKRLGPHPDDI